MLQDFCASTVPGGSCQPLEYAAVVMVAVFASWRLWTRADAPGPMTSGKVAMNAIGVVGILLALALGAWGDGWFARQLYIITHLR